MRSLLRPILVLFALVALCPPLDAQTPPAPRQTWGGDFRAGYFGSHREERAGGATDKHEFRVRVRYGAGFRFTDALSGKLRLAGRFSPSQDEFDVLVRDHAHTPEGLKLGTASIDEAYLNYRPSPRVNLRVGRMLSKFALADLTGKSLDRVDSPNTEISWTDGAHLTVAAGAGWKTHVILQHNASEGPTNTLRRPLDFTADGSRVTIFGALENTTEWGRMVQRGLDVTYIPASLRIDGTATDEAEGYLALLGRGWFAWPLADSGARFGAGGELGYAPSTPSRAALHLGEEGSGDVGGLAYQLAVTLSDLSPGHQFGIVYGYAEAGWLIAPDFRNNDRLIEGRYKWNFAANRSIDARLRRRHDLEQPVGTDRKREDTDLYVRLNLRF